MCSHLTKETNMQVPFKDKKKYLKDELKKLGGFDMGWVMKAYDDTENGNAVSLYAIRPGALDAQVH